MSSDNVFPGRESKGGMYVRKCRGHYHITTVIGDLIYPTHRDPEEAWAEIERIEAMDEQERNAYTAEILFGFRKKLGPLTP